MVFSRPISRCLPLASRATLSSLTARHLSTARAPRLASSLPSSSRLLAGSKLASVPSSIRALTTAREKVKVLLVLYDGGKHAEQVSSLLFIRSSPQSLLSECGDPITPSWSSRKAPTATHGFTFCKGANWPPAKNEQHSRKANPGCSCSCKPWRPSLWSAFGC